MAAKLIMEFCVEYSHSPLSRMCTECITHWLMRVVLLICFTVFHFILVWWVGGVHLLYICPHPPASFRIRVECHFLSLFPRLPPLSEPSQTLPALSTQPYSAGCEVVSHLATQTDTSIKQAEPSDSGSAWSAFCCALSSKLWVILSPLMSIIHEQRAWTAEHRVQYVQTICLMTQPTAWSSCILQHSGVPFSETEGPGIYSALFSALCDG